MYEALAAIGPWAFIAIGAVAIHYMNVSASQRRLELLHQERLAAMEKGIPLPELPVEPPSSPRIGANRAPNPNGALLAGVILLFAGVGLMWGFMVSGSEKLREVWSVPAPIALVGLGLILYHFLSRKRAS